MKIHIQPTEYKSDNGPVPVLIRSIQLPIPAKKTVITVHTFPPIKKKNEVDRIKLYSILNRLHSFPNALKRLSKSIRVSSYLW